MPIRLSLVIIVLTAAFARAQTTRSAATQPASTQPANALEKIAAEMIPFIDGVADTLKTVTDEATAKAALPKLTQAAKDGAKLRDATQKAGKPADDVMAKVMEKYGAQLRASSQRLLGEVQRVRSDAALEKVVGKAIDDLQLFQASAEKD
jgi:hypothetical protein